jgi:von Willebrand factor type A domain
MLTNVLRQRPFILTAACACAVLAAALAGCNQPDASTPSGVGGTTGTGGATAGGPGHAGTGGAGTLAGTDYSYPDGGVKTAPASSHGPSMASETMSAPGAAPPLLPAPTIGGTALPPSGSSDGTVTGGGTTTGPGGVVNQHPCATPPCVPQVIPPGQLTAGEWNDLGHWDFFLNMLQQTATDGTPIQGQTRLWGAAQTRWGLFPTGRIPVTVTSGGAPAINVPVELRDQQGNVLWQAVTDNHGSAQLFAGMFAPAAGPFSVRAGTSSPVSVGVPAVPAGAAPIAVSLPGAAAPAPALDLMFLVDTTGSMGDELKYIQSELEDVVTRVKAKLPAETTMRLSVNFYKDLRDEYVVRAYPFTTDLAATVNAIALQSAGGGDDTPEAVDHALQVAVDEHDWNAAATARLMIMVLDAPPHDDVSTMGRVRDAVAAAAAKGIQIIPVGASGIDKSTELLLRFFAIATGGSYAFLTDDSGIGNPHLDPSPTIGPFDVELLNDLLVRVIADRV